MDDLLAFIILGTLMIMAGIGLYKAETASGILGSLLVVCIIAYIVVYEY
jgi:hypothetical protein